MNNEPSEKPEWVIPHDTDELLRVKEIMDTSDQSDESFIQLLHELRARLWALFKYVSDERRESVNTICATT